MIAKPRWNFLNDFFPERFRALSVVLMVAIGTVGRNTSFVDIVTVPLPTLQKTSLKNWGSIPSMASNKRVWFGTLGDREAHLRNAEMLMFLARNQFKPMSLARLSAIAPHSLGADADADEVVAIFKPWLHLEIASQRNFAFWIAHLQSNRRDALPPVSP